VAARLRPTEEFIALFNNLKTATGGSPERVLRFYKDSTSIRDALHALHDFLARSDLERRVLHGRKVLIPRAAGFEDAWNEYYAKWRFKVIRPEFDWDAIDWDALIANYEPDHPTPPEHPTPRNERVWEGEQVEAELAAMASEPERPDPETDASFDPIRHDGGAAIELGVDRWEFGADGPSGDEAETNSCSIALGAYDYLVETIGLDLHEVFRRWRKVPVVFMPAHVANRYGASEKGSLLQLLDDAVRAYVFGAPAAAIAMCRSALEMVLKRHYGHGQWENAKLGNLVFLASKQYDFIKKGSLMPLVKQANRILHNYGQMERLSEQEDRTILRFLETVKFLIQRAPAP
jgi:hypothetical protein